MLEEAGNLVGLEVYTPNGIFVGVVNNLVIDLKNNKVDGLFLDASSPALVDHGVPLNIPFRWVQSVGDIIILRAFPDRVSFSQKEAERSLPSKGGARSGKRGKLTKG
ncbi:MAG: PRC-barrel domain-containing protein [Methanomassiliicoccaceae archaeon]|jgi:sporulation protein YlmC with PRC-barrel domain|nr:PRC-barrel domain-containing protein [Methanomassiliicoccaceae archaeon]